MAGYGLAHFRGSRGPGAPGEPGGLVPDPFPDRDFVICRLMYPEGFRFANGWRTDYPLGINLLLHALTH